MIEIREVVENKKQFLSLLLLADEQEDMIDKYIADSTMYILDDNGIKGECVVLSVGNNTLEIKNIAIHPDYQRKGYGQAFIDFLIKKYRGEYSALQVGTGESRATIPFYEKCGFIRSHIIKNFFIDNYENPIYEEKVQLVDMIYLKRDL